MYLQKKDLNRKKALWSLIAGIRNNVNSTLLDAEDGTKSVAGAAVEPRVTCPRTSPAAPAAAPSQPRPPSRWWRCPWPRRSSAAAPPPPPGAATSSNVMMTAFSDCILNNQVPPTSETFSYWKPVEPDPPHAQVRQLLQVPGDLRGPDQGGRGQHQHGHQGVQGGDGEAGLGGGLG